MKFKKIKFNSKDKTLELSYNEYDGQSSNEVVVKCGQIVHTDFIEVINALKYHFAYLSDLRELGEINESEDRIATLHEHTALKEVSVQSVVFSSNGDDDAIMLCGGKRFNGKHININTPLTPLSHDGYIHYWELLKVLETLQEEARLYLYEQKWGVVQKEIDFGMDAEFTDYESEQSQEPILIPIKKGRRSKNNSDSQPLTS